MFTYRQLLLNGYLHKEVINKIYNKNSNTWNTLLLSLESGIVLGLAKLLENKYFGRSFEDEQLYSITEKIKNVRNCFTAHNDLLKIKNKETFLERNKNMNMPGTCSVCNKSYLKAQNNQENICSECRVDEALHKYLQALRQKEGKLSFIEWLFISIKG